MLCKFSVVYQLCYLPRSVACIVSSMPECSKCVEGSGNTVGHPGRHRVALPQLSGEKRDRAQLGDDDTQGTGAVDCALCLKGGDDVRRLLRTIPNRVQAAAIPLDTVVDTLRS